MPFSCTEYVDPIVKLLHHLQFKRVLDLGIGIGEWGYHIRYQYDLCALRLAPSEWQYSIEGIEGHAAYRNPTWDFYNKVTVADVPDYMSKTTDSWDLICMIEVLEHLEKPAALELLGHLAAKSKHLLFSYSNIEQGAWQGNELERHRSKWTQDEIMGIFPRAQLVYEIGLNAVWYVPCG